MKESIPSAVDVKITTTVVAERFFQSIACSRIVESTSTAVVTLLYYKKTKVKSQAKFYQPPLS